MTRVLRFVATLSLALPLVAAEASIAPLLTGVGLFGSYAPPPPGAINPAGYEDDIFALSFDLNNGTNTVRNEFPEFRPHYREVAGYPLEHVQHTARFPHRASYGDHAYFVGTQSNGGGGWVWVAKSYDGVFRADFDASLINPDTSRYQDGFAGKVVWYTRTDANHPGGGCNHPGNVTVHNNAVLAVACQDWPGRDFYGTGIADLELVGGIDHVLFYSIVNPGHPVYLGRWRVTEPHLDMENRTLKSVSLMESGGYTHVVVGSEAKQKHFFTSKYFLPSAPRRELATDGNGEWTSGGLNVFLASDHGVALAWWRAYTESKSFLGVTLWKRCEQEFRFTNVQYENAAGVRTEELHADTVKVVVPGGSYTGDDIHPDPIHDTACNTDLYPSETKWCASTHAMWTGPDGTPVQLCADHAIDDGADPGFYFRYYPQVGSF